MNFLEKMLFSDVISFYPCIFHKSEIIYQQKLKSEKVISFFVKSTYLWKKTFISRNDMIVFIYKSWSANSERITFFVRWKITRGDSLDFNVFLTTFSLQEQSF